MDLAAVPSSRAPAPSEMIGRVTTVNGAQASVELAARAAEKATVGRFIGLLAESSIIIGLITEVGEQAGAVAGAASSSRKVARLDLIGELRTENGKACFQRGVTEYPNIGDQAQMLPDSALRAVYGMADADRAHIGDLQQNPDIP